MLMYFIFFIPGMLLMLWAQSKVKGNYNKYSKVANMSGMTGAQAARRILDSNGLHDVPVEAVRGELSDHYDPRHKVLRLSSEVYHNRSAASVGIAAGSPAGAAGGSRGGAAAPDRGRACAGRPRAASSTAWKS